MGKICRPFIFPIIITMLVAVRCANPVAPTGGSKDTNPPVIIALEPPNGTTDFQEGQFRLSFDEFIQLNNVNDEVFLSPPAELPEFKLKGRSVQVTFEGDLEDSTTYSVFFGKAISDLNEGNVLPYFTYVFSTGPVLDSMSIMGEVVNAFDLKPQKDVLVMLYKSSYDTIPLDSVPYLVRPLYVTRTIEEGVFVLNNLRPGHFKIFALNDINKNFLFDLPNEDIAFLDSLIVPEYFSTPVLDTLVPDTIGVAMDSIVQDSGYYMIVGNDTIRVFEEDQGQDSIPVLEEFQEQDSIMADTSLVLQDTLLTDSVATQEKPDYNHYRLSMFREVDSTQRLLEAKLEKEAFLRFVFRFPVKHPHIVVSDTVVGDEWKTEEWNRGRDTLVYWIRNAFTDSLNLIISDDTLVLDTVKVPLIQTVRKGRINKQDKKPEPLKFSTNLRGGKMDLNGKASMIFEYPVTNFDFSQVLLIEEADTQFFAPVFIDTPVNRRLLFDIPWKESASYEIIIPDSILTDLTGKQNDSLNFRFGTLSPEDYGILRMKVSISDSLNPYVVQLLDGKEKVLREAVVEGEASLEFQYLQPAKYVIKAIQDRNRNGRWDSGNYLKGIQPEKVYYFPESIEIRGNWEMDEEWNLIPE